MKKWIRVRLIIVGLVLSQTVQLYMIKHPQEPNLSKTTVEISTKANKAVVQIRSNGAMGTGSIIDERGYILTCQHVVDRSTNGVVTVSLYNNSADFVGKIVWQDKEKDLALVKINLPTLLPTLAIAKDLPKVGELVLTIGHPFGRSWTVGFGIVSKYVPNSGANFIQHTALTHPGNSGGPLLNMKGELVGVDARTLQMGPFYTPLELNLAIDGDAIHKFLSDAEQVVPPAPEVTRCTDY